MIYVLLILLAYAAAAPTTLQKESLRYNISWPSGLSLGDGLTQQSPLDGDRVQYEMNLDASVPGFQVEDRYRSVSTRSYCSVELNKAVTRGARKIEEQTLFDLAAGTATRKTSGGGESQFSLPSCPHDALTFLFFLRKELAQGRLPSTQTVWFGAPYDVSLSYGGSQNIRVNDSHVDADRILASIKGPSSLTKIELFFARDNVRTLLLLKVPLPAGTFTMELAQK